MNYFKPSETACKGKNCCGGASPMDRAFMYKMNVLRAILGKRIIVNSGFRCTVHNKNVGGSPNSKHMLGIAMDVYSPDCSLKDIEKVCIQLGLYHIMYDTFIHIDDRGTKWVSETV